MELTKRRFVKRLRAKLHPYRLYYKLFGLRGLSWALKADLIGREAQVSARVPGLKQPVYLRLQTTDFYTFQQVFVDRDYDFDFVEPLTIIDAGAYVGFSSVYFANKYPNAQIFAIEPESSNFALLERNIKPYKNITPIKAGLWKEEGRLAITDPGSGAWGFQTVELEDRLSTSEDGIVRGMTVSSILAEYGIAYVDLMKIDIEGAEVELFDDSSGWIDKVGVIIIELHDRLRDGCSRSFEEATKALPFESRRGENIIRARSPIPAPSP